MPWRPVFIPGRAAALKAGQRDVAPGRAALIIAAILVGVGLIAGMAALAYRDRRKALAEQLRQIQALEEEIAAPDRPRPSWSVRRKPPRPPTPPRPAILVAISHEMRSPLNAIYGYAQLLEREDAIPPLEAGGVIRRSAEHLTNLVEGLLDIFAGSRAAC